MPVIKVENLSKEYRLGTISHGTLTHDLQSWWARLRGKEDPNSIISSTPSLKLNPSNLKLSDNPHFLALNDISFEAKRGEILGIIGRNGAGKSTLLKILSEVTAPTKGTVKIKGRVGSLLEVGIGFHPEQTGRENVYINGAILGMTRNEVDRKFDEIVDFSGVEKFIDTPVKRYSSGMYVRLAFAVAAHLEPDVLIVDEVLAVGDLAFQKKCLGKMGQIGREGRTVLFVSHNMTPILELCSRAIWINAGRIVQQGDVSTVVSQYARDNSVSLGETLFDPPAVSNGAYLERAYVTDDEKKIRPDIPYEKPFRVVFEYRVEFPIDGLSVGFRLHNERDIAVLHTATADCSDPIGVGCSPGGHEAGVQIPGAWLAPGRYYVEIGIWSPGIGHHQYIKEGFAFDIIKATVGSIGEEVLRPILEWNLR